MDTNRQRPIILIVCLGGILRLAIAWTPFEWLLRYVLCDDAFYYFTIARNAAHGYGVTFDRLAATNGFHPLWLSILIPLQNVVSDRIVAVHVALSFSAAIDTLTIYLLWVLLRKHDVRQGIRLFVCTLYAFSPILFSHAGPLSGLETALNLMLITAYLIVYGDMLRLQSLSIGKAFWFGIVSVLLFLVRTDNVVLLALTYCHLGFRFRKQRRNLLRLTSSAMLALIVAAPWLLWSYSQFGSIVQVSGLSVAFVSRMNVALQGWGLTDYLYQIARNIIGITTFFPLYLYDTRIVPAIPILTSFLLGSLVVTMVWSVWSEEGTRQEIQERMLALAPLLLALIVYIVVHTFRGVYLRAWYYTSLLPVLILFFAVMIELLFVTMKPRLGSKLRIVSAIATLLVLIGYSVAATRVFEKQVGEKDKYEMVVALNRIKSLLPDSTIIGSWNAGVYGYFFDRGVVVNLDGLVNNVAFEYIKNRSLESYCRDVGVSYLVDPPGSLHFWRDYWRPEPVDTLRQGKIIFSLLGKSSQDSIVVMHLTGSERMPIK